MIDTKLGPEVDKFLTDISPKELTEKGKLGSSAKSYKPGLSLFQSFLSEQSLNKDSKYYQDSKFRTLKDISTFFKAVEKDKQIKVATLRKFPDRELSKSYGEYLGEQNFAAKTIRAYVSSIQALFRFWEIPTTTAYADLPSPTVENPKFKWSLQLVGEFIQSFDKPLYRCLGVWMVQSGLSNIDLLKIKYSQIRQQYEQDVSPLCLNMVRWKTRKSGIPFRTFVGAQGLRYFKEYYESPSLPHALSDDDLIFKISSVSIEKYFERRSKVFLAKVQPPEDNPEKKQEPTKKLRNQCVPSSLRTCFRTLLSDAKIEKDNIEYFMGHNLGSLGKTYTNRSDDSWRAVWKKDCERFLTFKETKIA